MGPTLSFVYIVLNNKNEFVDVYFSRNGAEDDLPEAVKQKKTQINRTDWAYGSFQNSWKVLERSVKGSRGLPLEAKQYR
ncbi:MAG: hypothetical protein ACXADW_02860 [Candidatus Hodarchaeales archaeon]|jgi:hypothetical protein